MASGIKVTDECYKAYSDLKTKAKRDDGKKQPRCIIFKINDTKTEVVIDKIIERGDDEHQEEEFRHIVENLPAKDGRYLLIDLWVPSGGQTENEKLLFVTWNPDEGPVGKKMIYSSSKESVKRRFENLSGVTDIQANDKGDLDYRSVRDRASTAK